jgi:hypothetical protein
MNYENLEKLLGLQGNALDHGKILDPGSEISSKAKKSPLNGLWTEAALSFWAIKEECLIPYVACGTALVIPSERLRALFEVDGSERELMVTVAMGAQKDDVDKTARVMTKMGNVTVDFYVKSVNGYFYERKVSQTIFKEGEVTTLVGTDSEDEAFINYKSTINAIRRVENWKKPVTCNNCPVNNLDSNLLNRSGSF